MWCLLSPQDPTSHLTRLTSHNFCLFRPYCGIAPARSPSSGSAKRSAPCLSNSCERAVAWDTVTLCYAMYTDCKVLVFCRIWPYCPCFQSQIVWLSSSFHSCATALVVVVQILQQVFFLLPWTAWSAPFVKWRFLQWSHIYTGPELASFSIRLTCRILRILAKVNWSWQFIAS